MYIYLLRTIAFFFRRHLPPHKGAERYCNTRSQERGGYSRGERGAFSHLPLPHLQTESCVCRAEEGKKCRNQKNQAACIERRGEKGDEDEPSERAGEENLAGERESAYRYVRHRLACCRKKGERCSIGCMCGTAVRGKFHRERKGERMG